MIVAGYLLIDADQVPELGWVEVDASGRIVAVESGDAAPGLTATERAAAEERLICPAFVDAHMHFPQIHAIGYDGLTLLDWLEQVIYPAESRWSPLRSIEAVLRMVMAGTFGCAGYLTSDHDVIDGAALSLSRIPMRAMVGRVMMDREAPSRLLHAVPENNEIDAWLPPVSGSRIEVSLNPRFAISCSDETLAVAGAWASQRDCFVQTHLAETRDECARVASLFPNEPHYTAVYDRFGLLHDKSLLAHAIHLSTEEWETLANRRCVAVHCPTANLFLQAGSFDLRAAREHGVRIALGSDVAAGPDLAMPRVARAMIETGKWRRMTVDPHAAIPSAAEVWTLITRGNADALGWHDSGRIEPGAWADLLVLRPGIEMTESSLVSRLIYNWDASIIQDRIVRGRRLQDWMSSAS